MNTAARQSTSNHARIRSRRSLVQAYYQWLMTKRPVGEIITEFKTERTELKKADIEYFDQAMHGMVENCAVIDSELALLLDRPGDELDPVENAILHLGTYELMFLPEVPYRVVINEAVDLAKMFGAEQSHKYINGVLDKIARKFRPVELNSR
jgi:N utilization substance protein B